MYSTVLRILGIGIAGVWRREWVLWNELKGESGGKILVKGDHNIKKKRVGNELGGGGGGVWVGEWKQHEHTRMPCC